MSIVELAAGISQALEAAGIVAVLSGGAAISVYTENRYLSSDLDFVTNESVRELSRVLEPLGFEKGTGRYFEHPDTDFYLEFPPGPLAIGGTVITEWSRLETPYGIINILSPTQMVMDRLAAFMHWTDPQALDQAVMVARAHALDWSTLEAWAVGEGEPEKYETFKRTLRRA